MCSLNQPAVSGTGRVGTTFSGEQKGLAQCLSRQQHAPPSIEAMRGICGGWLVNQAPKRIGNNWLLSQTSSTSLPRALNTSDLRN
jgi:hypothetical protein